MITNLTQYIKEDVNFDRKILFDFPIIRQATPDMCGAACMQGVLRYYGIEERIDEVAKGLNTNAETGTSIKDMVEYPVKSGLKSHFIKCLKAKDLIKYIDLNIPVIIMIQAYVDDITTINWKETYDWGHWVVAIGYDSTRIIFSDPASFNRTYLTYSELDERWHACDDKDQPDPESIAIIIQGHQDFDSAELVHLD
jgi:ABC-type bacteriocin/lantibiotic exporter with double-glycine peptidase domain